MFKKITLSIFILVQSIFLYAQNVGIGTQTPDPSAKLDITDSQRGLLVPRISIPNLSAAAPVTSPATSLLVYNTNPATEGFYYWNGTEWTKVLDNMDTDHDWYEAGTTNPPNSINDNIYTQGNVGIGTDNPLFQFEMHGQAPNMNLYRYDNSVTPAVFRTSKARGTQATPLQVLANDGLGGLYFGGHNGSGWSFNTAYLLSSATEAFTPTNNGSNLSFYTTSNGTTSTTEKMRIANDGNVGIGLTTPSTKLDVAGVTRSSRGTISGNTGHVAFSAPGAIGISGANEYIRVDLPLNALVTNGDKGYTIKMIHKNYIQAGYSGRLLSEDIILFHVDVTGITPSSYTANVEADKLQSTYEYDYTFDIGANRLSLNIRPTVNYGAGRTSALDLYFTSRNNSPFDKQIIEDWVTNATAGIQSQAALSTQTVALSTAVEWTDGNRGGTPLIFATQADNAGNDVMITDAGQVGIGANIPSALLDINDGNSTSMEFNINSTSGYQTDFLQDNTGLSIGHNSNIRDIRFKTDATDRMTIAAGGNVGIGTTNPSRKLSLYSTVNNGSDIISETDASRRIRHWFKNGTINWSIGTLGSTVSPINSFNIRNETSNRTDFAIATNGNIGIQNPSPASTLSIIDKPNVGTNTDGFDNSILYINNGNAADGSIIIKSHNVPLGASIGALKFHSSPDGINYSSAAIKALAGNNGEAETLAFYTSNSNVQANSPTEEMRIQNGNVGIGTTAPTQKLEVNGSVKITDGSQGAGKVLVSDATGTGTWELPSVAPALIPSVSTGNLPVGATCPAGGSYTTSSVTLEPGIYNYMLYGCNNQIGQTGSGFNIEAVFVSGSGDASGTWHNTLTGDCGHYYTGVVRVTSTSQVAIRYRSYSGSTFNVPGANAENATFWKIN